MSKHKHCLGCIHCITREVPGEFHCEDGLMWRDPPHKFRTCELYPEKYHSWMETFGQVSQNLLTDEDYSCFNDCYEGNEFSKSLDEMITLAQDILDRIDKK